MNKPNSQKKKILNKKPRNEAPRNEWLKYYLQRRTFLDGKPWNQAALIKCTGIRQNKISDILNGKNQNLKVDELVCISMALRLTNKEFENLMQRFERALSPEYEMRNKIYLKWISFFAKGSKQENPDPFMLVPVMEELGEHNLPSFEF
ncbi:hypothetical protein [Anaerotignum sp.]